jgi:hypothetical protein
LLVGNGDIFDFLVRFVSILKSEKKAWPVSFFNKIKVPLRVENTGNTESSPTRVYLDVYDIQEKGILESGDDKKLEKINPFETKEILAEFKTKLPAGTYYGVVSVYKGEEISRKEKIIFNIEKTPFSKKDWILISASLAVLAALAFAIFFLVRFLRSKKRKIIS